MSDKDTPMTNDSATINKELMLVREFLLSEYRCGEAEANGFPVAREAMPAWDALHNVIDTLSQPSDVGDIVERLDNYTTRDADIGLIHHDICCEAAATIRQLSADNAAKWDEGHAAGFREGCRALQAKVDEAATVLGEIRCYAGYLVYSTDAQRVREIIGRTLSNLKAGKHNGE